MSGPAIGGVLGSSSIVLPFFITVGITALSMLCIAMFLPESLALENRSKHLTLQSFNTFSHFNEIFSMKGPRGLLNHGRIFLCWFEHMAVQCKYFS